MALFHQIIACPFLLISRKLCIYFCFIDRCHDALTWYRPQRVSLSGTTLCNMLFYYSMLLPLQLEQSNCFVFLNCITGWINWSNTKARASLPLIYTMALLFQVQHICCTCYEAIGPYDELKLPVLPTKQLCVHSRQSLFYLVYHALENHVPGCKQSIHPTRIPTIPRELLLYWYREATHHNAWTKSIKTGGLYTIKPRWIFYQFWNGLLQIPDIYFWYSILVVIKLWVFIPKCFILCR